MPLVGCPTVSLVSLVAEIGELECVTGTSLSEPVHSGSALGMGVDMA